MKLIRNTFLLMIFISLIIFNINQIRATDTTTEVEITESVMRAKDTDNRKECVLFQYYIPGGTDAAFLCGSNMECAIFVDDLTILVSEICPPQ